MSDAFQSSSTAQGRSFEELVATMLKISGWTVSELHATIAGVEVDIIAIDPAGTEWWIECKGSWRGERPGSRRGDTVKKAVGVAWYLSQLPDPRPYMLVTSHLPQPGTVSDRLLDAAVSAGLFAQINAVGFLAAPSSDQEDDQ